MTDLLDRSTQEDDKQPRRVISAKWALTGTLGLITVTGMAVVIWLGIGVAFKNTGVLLLDKAELSISMMEQRLEQHLKPAHELPIFLANRAQQGAFDPRNQAEVENILAYSFAAASQLNAAIYVDVEGWYISVFKDQDGTIGSEIDDWRDDPVIAEQMKFIVTLPRDQLFWGEPVYSNGAEMTLIFSGAPVYRDDEMIGAMVATLRVDKLSDFTASLGQNLHGNAFILYDHDNVLAHPLLAGPEHGLGPGRPLPDIDSLGDPIMHGLNSKGWRGRRLEISNLGHWSLVDETNYVYLYRDLDTARPKVWTVGAYFREDLVGQEFDRLKGALVFAAVTVLIAILACLLIAHLLTKSAVTTAAAAKKVSRLDLDDIELLPRSHIKESDQIGRAFNSMVTALRFFARYVPNDLVRRLIAAGELSASEERMLTVMFTDIRGFTSLSNQMGPAETAAFLNRHFETMGSIIEQQKGTIDKYMGDGVMAFWGAPEPMTDHAQRAVNAAVAIRSAIQTQNRTSPTPIAMRIGIATGKIIVGDIGSSTRMNYTVVGDAVNMAQRLEGLGRDLQPDQEAAILIDETTRQQLDEDTKQSFPSFGHQQLRGHNSTIEVFGLAPA